MVNSASSYLRLLGLTLLAALAMVSMARPGPFRSKRTIHSGTQPGLLHVTSGLSVHFDSTSNIVEDFVARENRVREAMKQFTFKRDVVLQTIGPKGEVTGEYIRNSKFIFDDRGNRIEHVFYHPRSTIREMRITKEDIQDLSGAQLLGIDITESDKYEFSYLGREVIDAGEALMIGVTPRQKPNPQHMSERYFVGRIWIEPLLFQIVKIKGIVEPRGKQRFPNFETWREWTTASFLFPSRTEADDILTFPKQRVHYRIKVHYYDYQRFASRVTITELAPPSDQHP
jgi:hypothetical protein